MKNRIVDVLVTFGSLTQKAATLVSGGMGLKDTLSSPPVLAFDADRTSAPPQAADGEEGQIHSITLKEYSAEELTKIYQGKPNLLPSAAIVAEASNESTQFGVGGVPKRGDAIYTVEQAVIRRGMVDILRPMRERHTVATRGLAKDPLRTSDRTVNIYTVTNAAGGIGNGTLIPTAIDLREIGLQQGLERVRIHPYMILPSTGNGANFASSAAAAMYSSRQMFAGCLAPNIIRDEKLNGTRTPTSRLLDECTIICPTNGRVTFSNRDEAAGLVALDIVLRGDARFSADSYFTDLASCVHGGQIGPEMICRAIGHSVIEFDPRRAVDALDARLTLEIAKRLLVGANSSETAELPVCALSEVAGLLECTQRPTGTDVATDTYNALADATHETIQATVLDVHSQLQQRADDYSQRLDSLADEFVKAYTAKQDERVQRSMGAMGLPVTVKRLLNAKEHQTKVAAEYLHRYDGNAGPGASASQSLVAQMQEQSQAASRGAVVNTAFVAALVIAAIGCLGTGMAMFLGMIGAILGWTLLSTGVVLTGAAVAVKVFASQRSTKRMIQLAIDATNADLALFENRVSNIRLMAGRKVVNTLIEHLARLHSELNRVATKIQGIAEEADKRFTGMSGGSVALDVPGVVLPTNPDIDVVVLTKFVPKMEEIIGSIIPMCIVNADAMFAQLRRRVQAEIASLQLDQVGVIDFLEHWPNAIDVNAFVTERINESWPTAPIDPTAEPGYTPPILRVIRSNGGSSNAGPFVEMLRKGLVEEVNQVRDQDFGDPRRIIVSHESRFISFRQISYLAVLEREAEGVAAGLEKFLVTCVPDPRTLDVFRCGAARDESAAWGTFFCAVAQKIITRNGDNTYVVTDAALRGMPHIADHDGRLAQGLPNIISRLTTDPTLRRTLGEMFLVEFQRDGKKTTAQRYLAAMHTAVDHVPANAVSKFREIGLREVCKLLPECRTAVDAAALVGFTPPVPTSRAAKRKRQASDEKAIAGGVSIGRQGQVGSGDAPDDGHLSPNGNGSSHRDAEMPSLRR